MPRRILVIDDNAEIRHLLDELLTAEEYQVTVSDFIEPERMAQHQPDLVILDYFAGHSPVGGHLIRHLRLLRATRHIPIVVCTTASTVRAENEPAFALPGVYVVFKPFEVSDLLHTVEQALLYADGQPQCLIA